MFWLMSVGFGFIVLGYIFHNSESDDKIVIEPDHVPVITKEFIAFRSDYLNSKPIPGSQYGVLRYDGVILSIRPKSYFSHKIVNFMGQKMKILDISKEKVVYNLYEDGQFVHNANDDEKKHVLNLMEYWSCLSPE